MKLILGSRELRLVLSPLPANRLPKRAAYSVGPIPVTSNAAFAGEAPALEYPWFLVDGKAYYATLDPNEKATEALAGGFEIAAGVAARPDPVRATTRTEIEKARIEKFKVTFAARV